MKHAWLLALRKDREEMAAGTPETHAVTTMPALENDKLAGHAATSTSAAALYTLMTDRPAAIFAFRRFF